MKRTELHLLIEHAMLHDLDPMEMEFVREACWSAWDTCRAEMNDYTTAICAAIRTLLEFPIIRVAIRTKAISPALYAEEVVAFISAQVMLNPEFRHKDFNKLKAPLTVALTKFGDSFVSLGAL